MSLAMSDTSSRGERTPLVGKTRWKKLQPRSCCVKFKAALLILCWNTPVANCLCGIHPRIRHGSVLAKVFDYKFLNDSKANQLQAYVPAILVL